MKTTRIRTRLLIIGLAFMLGYTFIGNGPSIVQAQSQYRNGGYTVFGGWFDNPWHWLTGRVATVYDEKGLQGAVERLDAGLVELCKPNPHYCAGVLAKYGIALYQGEQAAVGFEQTEAAAAVIAARNMPNCGWTTWGERICR